MTGRLVPTAAAVMLAVSVVGAAAFALVRWWERPQEGVELALIQIPLDRFDPAPDVVSAIAELPEGPAVFGVVCRALGGDTRCWPEPHVWVERDAQWIGHSLDVPGGLRSDGTVGVSATEDRAMVVGAADVVDGASGEPVPLIWRGEGVDELVVEQLPTSVGEVACERSAQSFRFRCPHVQVRAAAQTPHGSVLVTQQGRGIGTIGVYLRDDAGWRQLHTPDQLVNVEASAAVGGRLVLAGLLCPGCPDRRDAEPGLLATDDGTTWDRVGADVLPSVPIVGLVAGRHGAVAALAVEDHRCRLAHSRDGRGWKLLDGGYGCDGHLRLGVTGDLVTVADIDRRVLEVQASDGARVGEVRLPPGMRLADLAGAGDRFFVTATSEDLGHRPLLFELSVAGAERSGAGGASPGG